MGDENARPGIEGCTSRVKNKVRGSSADLSEGEIDLTKDPTLAKQVEHKRGCLDETLLRYSKEGRGRRRQWVLSMRSCLSILIPDLIVQVSSGLKWGYSIQSNV